MFIGAHSKLVAAVALDSGALRWQRQVADAHAPQVLEDAAIEATAAVSRDGQHVFVTSYDSKLHALRACDGHEVWSVATGAEVKGAPRVTVVGRTNTRKRPRTTNHTGGSADHGTPSPARDLNNPGAGGLADVVFFGSHDHVVRGVLVGVEGLCQRPPPPLAATATEAAAMVVEGDDEETNGNSAGCNNNSSNSHSSKSNSKNKGNSNGSSNNSGSNSNSSGASGGLDVHRVAWAQQLDGAVYASPVVAESDPGAGSFAWHGRLLLVATTKGSLYAWDLRQAAWSEHGDAFTMPLLWRHDAHGPIFATPAVDLFEGVVLLGSVNGAASAVDLSDGSCRWSIVRSSPVFGSPCLARVQSGGSGGGERGEGQSVVFLGANNGELSCRRTSDGRRVWSAQFDASVFAAPFLFSAPRVAEEGAAGAGSAGGGNEGAGLGRTLLAAASRDGTLRLLDATTGTTLGEHRLTHDGAPVETFSSPVVVDDGRGAVLLIGARDDFLHAFDLVPLTG